MPGRYASALFDLARDAKSLDAIETDMAAFEEMLDNSADLTRLVRSPVYSVAEQQGAIEAVLKKAGIGGLASNFISLVTKNRRLFAIRDMIKAYRALLAAHRGEMSAELISAKKLTKSQLDDLTGALKSATGADVRLATSVDPSLIGGMIVRLGSRMVDNSLKTKLDSLRIAMKEVG